MKIASLSHTSTVVDWAEWMKEQLKSQPDRWLHVEKAWQRAQRLDAPDLEYAALLHDVGRALDPTDREPHALVGANFLYDKGFREVAALVAHHSGADTEVEVRGFGKIPAKFNVQNNDLLAILTYIDMTTSPTGKIMTPAERYADIKKRYGDQSPQAKAFDSIRDEITRGGELYKESTGVPPHQGCIAMKLLLTSAGITTSKIADALNSMLDKPIEEAKVGFVPTAGNVETGNKDWLLGQFAKLQSAGVAWIDIVDISAAEVDWRKRLDEVDVIFVSGGNTFHLLDQVRKSGFDKWLKENIEKKVYVGVSAGSMLVTPKIDIAAIDDGDENLPDLNDLSGLGFVDFELSPHTPESVSVEANKEYAKTSKNKIYAYNDKSAVEVIDSKVEIIADGDYLELN